MAKRMPIYDEQPKKRAVAPGSFPPWVRESLVRKIQANDGVSRREAETQIEAMATEFREYAEPRRTLHLPTFYRTGMNSIVKAPAAQRLMGGSDWRLTIASETDVNAT
jgi:hypothetical protein